MGKAYRPKHKLLQDFTKLISKHNPMQLNVQGNPGAADEYEQEALSILSRFSESALHLCEDPVLQLEVAVAIVRESFVFWFNTDKITDPEMLSVALVKVYQGSYPQPEQKPASEVPSVV